ncbi:hypothetical protein DIC82_08585 [Clostridium beijerinckii]|nr:hypothetical protein DIC82_08585 [Clostridium beijerinckii]
MVLSLEHVFEFLIKDLFMYYGYAVENENTIIKNSKSHRADLIISSNKSEKCIVEIKMYITRKADYGILKQAALQLKFYGEIYNIKRQLLIVGSPIDEKLKVNLEEEFQIKIYDSKNLMFLSKVDDSLYMRFKGIMSNTLDGIYIPEEMSETKIETLFEERKERKTNIVYKRSGEGEEFLRELDNIKPGREDFLKYEKKCTDILKYLFLENLNGWNEQLRTDDELNRFDLICRVKQGNEFWELLINEFKSRYVVFEFKNYAKQINQTQIYTTEKYLFQTALRNVGFIISREGASVNAVKSAKGILRETGKLIVNLTSNDLRKMLEMKDSGNEPSDYLFSIVDKFLLELEK